MTYYQSRVEPNSVRVIRHAQFFYHLVDEREDDWSLETPRAEDEQHACIGNCIISLAWPIFEQTY